MSGPGGDFLNHLGLADDYPGWDKLASEVEDAMWEVGQDVVREWKARDPVLRAMADERCRMWEWISVPAGDLALGTKIELNWGDEVWKGVLRAQTGLEHRSYPDRLGVDWNRWPAYAYIKADTLVRTLAPVPYDLSALLAIQDAEAAADKSR